MNINLNESDIEFIINRLNIKILECDNEISNGEHRLWDTEKNEIVILKDGYQKIIDKISIKKIDIKYIDIPNICFSLTDKDDYREEDFIVQRMDRGFDDSETWSLRDTISNFILPRLISFKTNSKDYFPSKFKNRESWDKKIDKMIVSFEYVSRDNGIFDLTKEEYKKCKKGIKLFRKHFLDLWY